MPTQVPNSGYVEKVYFNTDLSENDIHNLIDTLTLYQTPFFNFPVYPLLFSSDFEFGIILSVTDEEALGKAYMIAYANATTNETTTLYYKITNSELEYTPLTTKELVVNKEVIAEYSGLPIGAENDKLINLISTTPFEEPIPLKPFLKGIADAIREKKKTTELINAQNFRSEILSIKGGLIEVTELPEVGEEDVVYKLVKKGGTAVPTSGYVEKVYINTNYTSEEIKGIIEEYATIPLQGLLGYPIAVDVDTGSILGMLYNDTGFYTIGVIYNDGLSWTLDTNKLLWGISLSTGEGVFDNEVLTLNWRTISVADGIPIGSKNNELTNLISTIPSFGSNIEEYYIYENGIWVKISKANIVKQVLTQVPNSGYVEKVYFNISLSAEDVRDLLKELTYNITPFLPIPISPLLFASDGNPVIFAQYIGDDYAIIVATDIANRVFEYAFTYDEGNPQGTNGFKMSEYTINKEVIAEYSGLPIGVENDKLINLISATPFENQVIKELSGDYEAVELEVTENTTVDVGAMLDEGKMPLSVTVNVGGEDTLQQLVNAKGTAKFLLYNFEGSDLSFINGLDLSNVEDYTNMFGGNQNLLEIPNLIWGPIKIANSMFNGCQKITEFPNLDFSEIEQAESMFSACSELGGKINLELPKCVNLAHFSDVSKVEEITINAPLCVRLDYFQRNNKSLKKAVIIASSDSNVTLNSAFLGCENLESVEIQAKVNRYTDMSYLFNNCKSLKIAPLVQPYVASNSGSTMTSVFAECSSLREVPAYNVMNTNFNSVFTNCSSLENIWFINIWKNLQVGSGTTWGHLLTLESLIHLCKQCVNVSSARTLTVGSNNLEKLASIYVKFTDSSVTSIPTNTKGDVVVCESTDEGAMLIADYMALKNWTLA